MMKVLSADWRHSLAELAASARADMVICSPYIGRAGSELINRHTTESFRKSGRLTLVTDLSPLNIAQGATDPCALRMLGQRMENVELSHLPRIHAKVYIADGHSAIVTSGNLTAGGLFRNFESGVQLEDTEAIASVRQETLEYARLGALVPPDQLDACCDASDRLRCLFRQQLVSKRNKIRREFEVSLREAHDNLIRLRLADGPIHSVFARTIKYLLKLHGPMRTKDLHPRIQAIHPDLCDDSVDRVIGGKRFGKKWKHAVRTAQQQLKKQRLVSYEDGRWHPTSQL